MLTEKYKAFLYGPILMKLALNVLFLVRNDSLNPDNFFVLVIAFKLGEWAYI